MSNSDRNPNSVMEEIKNGNAAAASRTKKDEIKNGDGPSNSMSASGTKKVKLSSKEKATNKTIATTATSGLLQSPGSTQSIHSPLPTMPYVSPPLPTTSPNSAKNTNASILQKSAQDKRLDRLEDLICNNHRPTKKCKNLL